MAEGENRSGGKRWDGTRIRIENAEKRIDNAVDNAVVWLKRGDPRDKVFGRFVGDFSDAEIKTIMSRAESQLE